MNDVAIIELTDSADKQKAEHNENISLRNLIPSPSKLTPDFHIAILRCLTADEARKILEEYYA